MFRAAHRSSSEALTLFASSGVQVWVGTHFPLRLDHGRSPHAHVNRRLQIQLELLMMSGVPLETCWAFNERWNNKFYYKVASCWLFLLENKRCSLHYLDKYFFLSNLIAASHLLAIIWMWENRGSFSFFCWKVSHCVQIVSAYIHHSIQCVPEGSLSALVKKPPCEVIYLTSA
jgi:hypothetical protein